MDEAHFNPSDSFNSLFFKKASIRKPTEAY
jgi:hypothetical protein